MGWVRCHSGSVSTYSTVGENRRLGRSLSAVAVQVPELRSRLAGDGSEDLPETIEAVRAALLACMEGLEDCNVRTRRHWRQTEAGRRSGRLDDEPNDREKLALRRETESWGVKIRSLQELGLRLERPAQVNERLSKALKRTRTFTWLD